MHTINDITNQDETIHTFAKNETTAADERLAKRLIQKVSKHLEEFSNVEIHPTSVSFINKNKKNSRIIIYDIDKLLAQKDLFVVIFYANKRENLTEKMQENFFETDWKIAMSMLGTNDILCYASQELTDGNWFNIVLFTKEISKHDVTGSDTHHYAAYKLAPERFSWIRLHNAQLPGGVMEHKNFIMKKTKYYDFNDHWFAAREYKH